MFRFVGLVPNPVTRVSAPVGVGAGRVPVVGVVVVGVGVGVTGRHAARKVVATRGTRAAASPLRNVRRGRREVLLVGSDTAQFPLTARLELPLLW
jgi:hypothetical protein